MNSPPICGYGWIYLSNTLIFQWWTNGRTNCLPMILQQIFSAFDLRSCEANIQKRRLDPCLYPFVTGVARFFLKDVCLGHEQDQINNG